MLTRRSKQKNRSKCKTIKKNRQARQKNKQVKYKKV